MSRPPWEVADLVRSAGTAFIERNRSWIRWTHIKVLLAIVRCRTAALGGHIEECTRCGHRAAISYNSCRVTMRLSGILWQPPEDGCRCDYHAQLTDSN